MRRGRRWRGWDLLQRRYSMPEIAMRKYALSRSGSGSWGSSGSSSCSCRVDRSAQTTPSLGPGQRTRSFPGQLPGETGGSGGSGDLVWGAEDTPSPPALWTSSSATLSQTVSDRTTSTQDSTLSIPSTTPERPSQLNLDPVIFVPAGGNIVIDSEAALIRPLEVETSRSHFTFGSSDSTPTAEVVSVVSRQVSEAAVNTETDCTESVIDETAEVAVRAEESVDDTDRTATYRSKLSPSTSRRSIGCQSENQGVLLEEDPPLSQHVCCDRQTRLESRFFGSAIETTSWSQRGYVPRVSCASSGNYKEPPGEEFVVPRYSAVPRTGSMLVNTSSVDYTSDDSDLSLTDSLEDAVERAPLWPSTKHDNRLVRGEVNTHEEINTKKKYIKSKNTYAYFLFLSGEEDVIKEYSLPDKLKTRLKQKEEEIKKHFETKFACFKKPPYRKRKKLKFVRRNSESSDARGSKTVAVKPRAVCKSTQCFDKTSQAGEGRRRIVSKPVKHDPELDHAIANILMASIDPKGKSCKRDENWNLNDRRVVTSDVGTSVPDFETPLPEVSEERDITLVHSCKDEDAELLEGNSAIGEASVRHVATETIEIAEQHTQTEDGRQEQKTQTMDRLQERKTQTVDRVQEQKTQTLAVQEQKTQTIDRLHEQKTQTEEVRREIEEETQTEDLREVEEQTQTVDVVEVETQTEDEPPDAFMVEKSSSPIWATASVQTSDSLLNSSPEDDNPLNKGTQVSVDDVRGAMEDVRNNNASGPPLLPQIRIESIGDMSLESFDNGEEEAAGFLTVPDPEAFVRTENDKNVINSLTGSFAKKEACLRNKTAKGSRSNAEILEINVPVCTCHMCTFEKMTTSPSARERAETRIAQRVRPSPSPQSTSHSGKQLEKRMSKPVARRNPIAAQRFLQKFEVIPEEKNSSTESAAEDPHKPLDLSPQWKRGRDAMPKRLSGYERYDEMRYAEEESVENYDQPKCVSRSTEPKMSTKFMQTEEEELKPKIEERNEEEKRKSVRTTRIARNQMRIPQRESKRPSVVIGRFKEKEIVGDGLIRQYKGRAALASTQEELVTLSKGWINFYLLRDSQDVVSDASTPEEAPVKKCEEKLLVRRGNEKTEEVLKQYTVEIQATPEPLLTRKEAPTTGLPDLKTRRLKKREKPSVFEEEEFVLPEIPSSSSSSSPESVPKLPESPPRLPDLRKEKKALKNVKKQKREKRSPSPDHAAKNQRLLKLPQGVDPLSRAVEIARSEHSVSSVTSSTLILSESPPPEKAKLPERRLQRQRQQNATHTTQQTTCINNTGAAVGSSWSVTVAGSSGTSRHPPPDVEMKLTFGNQPRDRGHQQVKEGSSDLVRYGQTQNTLRNHTARTSRQQGVQK